MKAMQMNLSKLAKQPNRSFASVLLVFSLFRFLHPHHPSSVNARYLCESGEIDPPAKTGAIAAQTFSAMKIWFSEFLQNAARDLTKVTGRGYATSSGPPVRPKLVS